MVYRRSKRRVMRKRRVVRKRKMLSRPSNMIRITRRCPEQNVYNNATAGTATASGTVVLVGTPYQTPAFAGSTYYNIPFSADFALADLVDSAELKAIAEQYKINKVRIKMYCTSNTASAGSTAQLPSIVYSIDNDDAAVPASTTTGLNLLRANMNSKVRQFSHSGKPLSLTISPKFSTQIYGAGGVAVGAQAKGGWLDTVSDTIPHFGLKGYLQDVNLVATPAAYTQFKFDVEFDLSLKGIQ